MKEKSKMEKTNEKKAKIGDKIVIPSKKYNDFKRKLENYNAEGVIIRKVGNKFDVRFTSPEDEVDFEKHLNRSEFKVKGEK